MNTYEEKTARIRELATNPDALVSHLSENTEGIQEAAPSITQGLHSAMSNGVAFLNSKIPQASDQMPMAHDYQPSHGQKTQFGRYFDAVNDPISLLDHVKKGTLSAEHLEAAQSVHPQLLDEMRKKVIEHMDPGSDKNLSYPVKMSLAKFLGQPLDGTMTPQSILSNQAALNLSAQQSPTPGSNGRKTAVAGFKNMQRSSRASTTTQEDKQNER